MKSPSLVRDIAELHLVYPAKLIGFRQDRHRRSPPRRNVVCILALFRIRQGQIKFELGHPFNILLDFVAIALQSGTSHHPTERKWWPL